MGAVSIFIAMTTEEQALVLERIMAMPPPSYFNRELPFALFDELVGRGGAFESLARSQNFRRFVWNVRYDGGVFLHKRYGAKTHA